MPTIVIVFMVGEYFQPGTEFPIIFNGTQKFRRIRNDRENRRMIYLVHVHSMQNEQWISFWFGPPKKGNAYICASNVIACETGLRIWLLRTYVFIIIQKNSVWSSLNLNFIEGHNMEVCSTLYEVRIQGIITPSTPTIRLNWKKKVASSSHSL